MALFATSMAVIAGACFGIGLLFLFVGFRRRTDRNRNLLFALFALAYGAAVLSARAAFTATSFEQYAEAFRVSTVIASVGFALLTWYVAVYTDVRNRPLLGILTAGFAAVGLATLAFPDLAIDSDAGAKAITLPWGEELLMGQEGDPALLPFYVALQLAMIGYILVANVVMYRRGARREALVLAIGLAWFASTMVEETLVVVGAIDFVVLSDFGFLGFLLAVSLSVANEAIEAEARLRGYRLHLEEMVAERTAELEAAQRQLLVQAEEQAAAGERNRLAHELHDVVTQLLFSINLIAGSLPRLWRTDPATAARTSEELQRLTRGALAEMRTLLRELRPRAIVETDLSTLVTHLSEGLAARQDIPVHVHTNVANDLPVDVHVAVYRIAQEAINNVARHSNASTLVVDLTGDDGEVRLHVADDGCGYGEGENPASGMGLGIMRERASEIGADLEVSSAPNQGTSVDVTWEAPSEVGAA